MLRQFKITSCVFIICLFGLTLISGTSHGSTADEGSSFWEKLGLHVEPQTPWTSDQIIRAFHYINMFDPKLAARVLSHFRYTSEGMTKATYQELDRQNAWNPQVLTKGLANRRQPCPKPSCVSGSCPWYAVSNDAVDNAPSSSLASQPTLCAVRNVDF